MTSHGNMTARRLITAATVRPIMRRRAVLASVPGALLIGGCTSLLGDSTEFEAERGDVAESASSETGYDEANRSENTIEREFDGVDATVVVINKITEYSRSVEMPLVVNGELARFTVLTSPGITVGPGDPANPIEDMNNDDLAVRVQQQYDTIDNVERLDEREAELLGETTTVTRYRADAETEGQPTEVNLHIAQGRSERSDGDPDFVVTVGIHPADVDESDNVDRLNAGVEHPE
jgi:hypothetical protein